MSDTIVVPAPRDHVFAALNDTDVLRASIPGCESLERGDDGDLTATVALKIGPVKARFRGRVAIDDTGAPERFSLSGEGAGGTAVFAKGGAQVQLQAIGASQTRLSYEVEAQIGGKLAQLGSRLVLGAARKLAARFFEAFTQQISMAEVAADETGAQ